MNADCVFRIGSTHKVCQDYAMAKKNAVVISDGCSGSRLSDMGSRLLCINFFEQLGFIKHGNWFLSEAQCLLPVRPVLKMLDLPRESLDATFGYVAVKDDLGVAKLYGDGAIIIGLKNGNFMVLSCEYVDGYPFFINYLFDESVRFSSWTEENNKRILTSIEYCTEPCEDGEQVILTNFNDVNTQTGGKCIDGALIQWDELSVGVVVGNIKDIQYLAVTSDGIASFYQTKETETSLTTKSISYMDVIKKLLPFKSFKGSFAQRRVNKFLKECKKDGWDHGDDISLGVIYFGD